MADSNPGTPSPSDKPDVRVPLLSPVERVFPTLTPAQIARVVPRGRVRSVGRGEVLQSAGHQVESLFVIREGSIEIVRRNPNGEETIAVLRAGQFTGETNMLSGRQAFVDLRAAEAGEVVEVKRDDLRSLVATDSELGEIFLRAFLLRRLELVTHGYSDVLLVGSNFCQATLRVKEFLTRNGHPYNYVDLDRDSDAQELLDRFSIREGDVPVLICRGTVVLRNPSNREIADCLGFNEAVDPVRVRDILIVGAGPAGLAAAVYGASEGLDVLILESEAPGGQAGSSSKIENYLGFPTGISGQELAARALTQAEKFGAELMIAKGARRLSCERRPYAIEVEDGPPIKARTVVIATGARYRRLTVANLERFEGAGVYYGATAIESQLCRDEEVIVVGGGNSAGQATVFLSQTTKRVYLLVRAEGLDRTMSRYLIRRIEDNPTVTFLPQTEIVALEGGTHLQRVSWRNKTTGEVTTHDIRHIFSMTGAAPSSGWLDRCVAMDDKGFIKTGPDLSREDLEAARWPLARPPHLLETSRPGVFAVGDVRGGNVKRVASAVGEGSIAISFAHQVIHE